MKLPSLFGPCRRSPALHQDINHGARAIPISGLNGWCVEGRHVSRMRLPKTVYSVRIAMRVRIPVVNLTSRSIVRACLLSYKSDLQCLFLSLVGVWDFVNILAPQHR